MRIFGNESNYQMIKSLLNSQISPDTSTLGGVGGAGGLNTAGDSLNMAPQASSSEHQTLDLVKINWTKSAESGKPKSRPPNSGWVEDKVERALLDLNEYKNNFMSEKMGYEQQRELANKDKDSWLWNTFYGTNKAAYATGMSFYSIQGAGTPGSAAGSIQIRP